MTQIDAQELGRRMRAARGYAGGASQRAFAKELGIGESSLKRLEAGDQGPAEVKLEAIISRAAEASRLPRRFFETDLWVLDYLGQAISLLPAETQRRSLDQLIFDAFKDYRPRPDADSDKEEEGHAGLDKRLQRLEARVEELADALNPRAEEKPPPAKQDQATPEPSLPDPPPIAPDPGEPKTDEEGRQQSA